MWSLSINFSFRPYPIFYENNNTRWSGNIFSVFCLPHSLYIRRHKAPSADFFVCPYVFPSDMTATGCSLKVMFLPNSLQPNPCMYESNSSDPRSECTLIGWPFSVQPIAAQWWRGRCGRKITKILGKNTLFNKHPLAYWAPVPPLNTYYFTSLRKKWIVLKTRRKRNKTAKMITGKIQILL